MELDGEGHPDGPTGSHKTRSGNFDVGGKGSRTGTGRAAGREPRERALGAHGEGTGAPTPRGCLGKEVAAASLPALNTVRSPGTRGEKRSIQGHACHVESVRRRGEDGRGDGRGHTGVTHLRGWQGARRRLELGPFEHTDATVRLGSGTSVPAACDWGSSASGKRVAEGAQMASGFSSLVRHADRDSTGDG